jgi:hypothetical protein
MLEKTDRTIKNGLSRDPGNIGNTGHRTKTNKTRIKHTTQQNNIEMSNTDITNILVVNPGASEG